MMASLVFIYVMNYNGISVLFIVYYCLYMYFKFWFFNILQKLFLAESIY